MAEHTGTIESAGWQKKYQGEGTTFCMKVRGDDDKVFSYYITREEDEHLREKAAALIGQRGKISYEQSGKYRNVGVIELALDRRPDSPQKTGSMTPDQWELKDRRITRVAIAKSLIEANQTCENPFALADLWFNWVWEVDEPIGVGELIILPTPERSTEDIDQSRDTLVAEIKKLADGQTIRNVMDRLGVTEAKLSDCDAGKLAEIRDKIKDSMLV